ncbi:hypothetical protein LMOh7858_2276 [Listeria monocytogenes str. 4b H7858]|nr:hypothetical protein LMOh7858_2276 [Listeria monocytogenes str. 4b H7858] [Listeria monocytogenes serotype 4b str. H7858]
MEKHLSFLRLSELIKSEIRAIMKKWLLFKLLYVIYKKEMPINIFDRLSFIQNQYNSDNAFLYKNIRCIL